MAGREGPEGGFHGIFAELRGLLDLGDLAAGFFSPPSLIMPHNLSVLQEQQTCAQISGTITLRPRPSRPRSQS